MKAVNPKGFTAFCFYVLCGGELFGSPSVLPLNSKSKPQCSPHGTEVFSLFGQRTCRRHRSDFRPTFCFCLVSKTFFQPQSQSLTLVVSNRVLATLQVQPFARIIRLIGCMSGLCVSCLVRGCRAVSIKSWWCDETENGDRAGQVSPLTTARQDGGNLRASHVEAVAKSLLPTERFL